MTIGLVNDAERALEALHGPSRALFHQHGRLNDALGALEAVTGDIEAAREELEVVGQRLESTRRDAQLMQEEMEVIGLTSMEMECRVKCRSR